MKKYVLVGLLVVAAYIAGASGFVTGPVSEVAVRLFYDPAPAKPAEKKKEMRSVVSFTFDDAPRSVYTQAFPLLKKAGLHATIYLSTGTLTKPGYVNWLDTKDLDASGWEIGAHTHTHADLTKLSVADFVGEIEESQRLFKERGYTPVSFSAPYGAYSERELVELRKVYSSNRAAWGNGGINPYPNFDAYNLVSLGITLETTLDEVREQVRTIKRDGGWLILQFHQIDDGQKEVGPFPKDTIYTTKIFPEILEMILKEEVPVRTIRDIIANQQIHRSAQ